MSFELHEACMADYLPDQFASLKGNPQADSAVRDVFEKMMFWGLAVAVSCIVFSDTNRQMLLLVYRVIEAKA